MFTIASHEIEFVYLEQEIFCFLINVQRREFSQARQIMNAWRKVFRLFTHMCLEGLFKGKVRPKQSMAYSSVCNQLTSNRSLLPAAFDPMLDLCINIYHVDFRLTTFTISLFPKKNQSFSPDISPDVVMSHSTSARMATNAERRSCEAKPQCSASSKLSERCATMRALRSRARFQSISCATPATHTQAVSCPQRRA